MATHARTLGVCVLCLGLVTRASALATHLAPRACVPAGARRCTPSFAQLVADDAPRAEPLSPSGLPGDSERGSRIEPGAYPSRSRGRGGAGRGRGGGGRGKRVLVLNNPMYAVRIQQPPPERAERPPSRAPGRASGGAPSGRGRPTSDRPPRRAPSRPDAVGMPAEDDDAPAAPAALGKDAPRRMKDGRKKRAAASPVAEREGPKTLRGDRPGRGGGRRQRGRASFDDEIITATARAPRSPRKKGAARPVAPAARKGPIKVRLDEAIAVGALAEKLEVGAAEVVKALMKQGVLASITQTIDADTAARVAEGFGAEVTRGADDESSGDEAELDGWGGVVDVVDPPESLVRRAPVVTVMGHVDHGKTSLLDALRDTDVTAGEAGGITQHIGASSVTLPSGEVVTFIDTPGHAAFSEMRSRGANLTDVVVLVVAADDGVKEQTIQSIRAAKAADVPIVVAINKVDAPAADASAVKTQLLEHEVVLEEFGGDVLSAEVSAKAKTNLDGLLDQLVLQAELLDLRANPERPAAGVVVEARQVVGRGAVATALVQKGTLKVGDVVVAGAQWGRVRRLQRSGGSDIESAGPSVAVELTGLGGLPAAGDAFAATEDESRARQIAQVRTDLMRERRTANLFASRSSLEMEGWLHKKDVGELPVKLIDLVVKSDVQGSAEALCSSLEELEVADDKLRVRTRVLRAGAGAISSEDVMLASVSSAVVLGFNSDAARPTKEEATRANVVIKEYSVVYDLLDDVRAMMASHIRPPPAKHLGDLVGTADVLQIFKIGAVGKVAGCTVLDGFARVGCNVRILRGNTNVYEGKLAALRSFKDAVDEVEASNECGMSFEDFQTIEPDDRVECYLMNE